jgi:2-haloacid dehalogenase
MTTTQQTQPDFQTAKQAARPAIIFDFGGVLIDWDPRYLYRKLFDSDEQVETFLREVDFFEWNLKQDAGRAFEDAVAELCAQFPHYCEMISAYDHRYDESLSDPISGTVEILRTLKQAGYALYGLSNWPGEKFRNVRHKFPFFEWFDDIVISGEVRLAKPDPRIFALLLERIGRPAQECVFIDDSAKNIAVAREMGFQTIQFEGPEKLGQALASYLS